MARRFCLFCGTDLDPSSQSGCPCPITVPAREFDWSAPRRAIDTDDRNHEARRARRAEREQQLDDAVRMD